MAREARIIQIKVDQGDALRKRQMERQRPDINLSHLMQDLLDIVFHSNNPTQRRISFEIVGGELRVVGGEGIGGTT